MPGAAASTAARNGFERLPPDCTVTVAAPVTTKSVGSMAVSTVECCALHVEDGAGRKRDAQLAGSIHDAIDARRGGEYSGLHHEALERGVGRIETAERAALGEIVRWVLGGPGEEHAAIATGARRNHLTHGEGARVAGEGGPLQGREIGR